MKLYSTLVIILFIAAGTFFIQACKKSSGNRWGRPTPISFAVPEGFPPPVYDFTQNPLTQEGFALGKKLFHDNRLSANTDVTCGSCHQQLAAFTTFDHDLGHGTNHQHTTRNVPVIFNLGWHSAFGWDGSAATLDDQCIACLRAPEKMGGDVSNIISFLSADAEYRELAGEAFGDEALTETRIAQALAQFVVSIVSSNSKYDQMKQGTATFNESEQQGYQIFQQKCATCHTEPLFTDLRFRSTGLPVNPFHFDPGRMGVTGSRGDSLKFKVPTLRNVSISSYYGHDGRYSALSQMLNHYVTGVVESHSLDPLLENKISLTELEKFYLQEFFITLNDSAMLHNKEFQ